MELVAQPGAIAFTIEITRAETGETETYELVGTIAEPETEPKEE